mgnify:CR=1 FL=1
MKYYVTNVSNLHGIRITPVEITSSGGRLVRATADVIGTFMVSPEYIYDTIDEAREALRKNVLEFKRECDYCLDKALED